MAHHRPAEVGLRPYPASGEPQSATVDIDVANSSEGEENGGFHGTVTYTFDLSALTGVADVRFEAKAVARASARSPAPPASASTRAGGPA